MKGKDKKIYKKNSIDYQQFSFRYYEIDENEFKSKYNKEMENQKELEPQTQVQFTLLSEKSFEALNFASTFSLDVK